MHTRWLWQGKLDAELHDIAQGGVALLDGTGYFCSDQLTGMESCYDKIQFSPYAEKKQWDFSRWTPDAVIIAIGQNDANPEPERIKTPEYRRYWKDNYIKLLRTLMEEIPRGKVRADTDDTRSRPHLGRRPRGNSSGGKFRARNALYVPPHRLWN